MKHTFESMQVGDTYVATRTFSPEEVQIFADISGDDNPLHLDPHFAATTPFGKPIVHGVFLMAFVSKILGRDYPGAGSVAVSLYSEFLRPIPVGESCTVTVEVIEKMEVRRTKQIRMKLTAVNEQGKAAFKGEAVLMPPTE